MDPLGKKKKAVRNGAPVAVVAARAAPSNARARPPTDKKDGTAMVLPSPRKNARRPSPTADGEMIMLIRK